MKYVIMGFILLITASAQAGQYHMDVMGKAMKQVLGDQAVAIETQLEVRNIPGRIHPNKDVGNGPNYAVPEILPHWYSYMTKNDVQTVNSRKDKEFGFVLEKTTNDYWFYKHDPLLSFSEDGQDTPFSIGVWAEISDQSVGQGALAGKKDMHGMEYIFQVDRNNRLGLFLFGEGSYVYVVTDHILEIGQFCHMVATYDGRGGSQAGEGINIYVNGMKMSTRSVYSGYYTHMNNTEASLWFAAVGNSQCLPTREYWGDLGSAFVTREELSHERVQSLFALSRGFYGE